MAATSDNYTIVTSGTTYTIASDYVKPSGAGETAHHQIVKVAYGANDTVNYVSNIAPMPVGLCGAWTRYEFLTPTGYYSLAATLVGTTGTVLSIAGVSGATAIGITVGTVTVAGASFSIRNLFGGAMGSTLGTTTGFDYVGVQGVSGAYPVGITVGTIPVSIQSTSNLGIFGVSGATAIGISASNFDIRGLTTNKDSITVYGAGISGSVVSSLYAYDTGISGGGISILHSTGNALKVNLASAATGVTVTANNLDIRDLNYTSDTVTVIGNGATDNKSKATVPTYVTVAAGVSGSLTQVGGATGAGWCAAAMNVYLVNSGFSFNAYATFSTGIGISQASYLPVPVQGTTSATRGVWVVGDTANGPVLVKGYSGGYLPVQVANNDIATSTVNTSVQQVKTNTDFLIGMKKALYSDSVSVGAFDFPDKQSIYALVRDNVGAQLTLLGNSIVANGAPVTSQSSLAVTVVGSKQQPSFMSRTGFVGFAAKNLNEFNSGSGFTCGSGVRIKTARIASGTTASSNQFLCVMSVADAGLYGITNGSAAYVLYHGEEMFFDVDNINKIQVFYPAYSSGFAPNNTSQGMTFSFYAS